MIHINDMNFRSFDLNLLRVLDALLTERSTVAAAQKLGLSQSAVSAALSRLRHALGDPLFVRHGRGLEPTDFAAGLHVPLGRLLEETENLLSGPGQFDPAQASQEFRISGADFFSDMLMPQLATDLRVNAPRMRVMLVDLVPDNYVDTVERYQVDLALLPKTTLPNWAKEMPVFHSTFVVIARRDHPRLARAGLKPGDTVPLDLYCDLEHVLFSPEGKTSAMGDAALARLGRKRHVLITLPTFAGVYHAVAESDLIALLPGQLARHVAPRVGLDIFTPPMPVPAPLITMVWHRRATHNPAHRWLRNKVANLLLPLNEGEQPLPESTT